MKAIDITEAEELSEAEFTHLAGSASIYTFVFVLFFSIWFKCFPSFPYGTLISLKKKSWFKSLNYLKSKFNQNICST